MKLQYQSEILKLIQEGRSCLLKEFENHQLICHEVGLLTGKPEMKLLTYKVTLRASTLPTVSCYAVFNL